MSVEWEPAPAATKPTEHHWLWVLCLLGLDYFSTLAYQPSITFAVAGRLGPIATAVVVLLTLFGALPVYCYLAGRAHAGGSAIGMLAELVHGWRGKTLILVLLGFAATDFTMLRTISLADAAVHILGSPDSGWALVVQNSVAGLRHVATEYLSEGAADYFNVQLVTTLLLGVLSFAFWYVLRRGFNRNVLRLAAPLVGAYLILNGILLVQGGLYLNDHPELVNRWRTQVDNGAWLIRHPFWVGYGWGSIAIVSVLFLPNLALGLSGFEMSMIVMPQVRGKEGEPTPVTRIRNTRKLLIVAALMMAVLLLGSSFMTTLLIPPEEFAPGGAAHHRALAYLAHGGCLCDGPTTALPWCGTWFGSAYDLVTVLVLIFAGTSVMTALSVLIPRFLLKFGMELKWIHRWGALLALFAGVNLAVTLYFRASVDAQRNAYASGVLVLISCGCLVAYLEKRRQRHTIGGVGSWLSAAFFGVVCAIFMIITVAVAIRSGSGLLIATLFILAILTLSVISRALRADELRTIGFDFKDGGSRFLWDSLRLADFPALVPHRPGRHEREAKEQKIRAEHQLDPEVDIVFLEVHIGDASDFFQRPLVEILREDKRLVLKLTQCASIPHAIAAVALEMSRSSKPPSLHFGWPELPLLTASWSYFAFGEGNIPWKVRELIKLAEADPAKRPRVIVG